MGIYSTRYDMFAAKPDLTEATTTEEKGKVLVLGSELQHMGTDILGTDRKLDHVPMKIAIQGLGVAGTDTLTFKLYTGTGSTTAGTLIATSKAYTVDELNAGIEWMIPYQDVQENLQMSYTASAASDGFSAGELYANLVPIFA